MAMEKNSSDGVLVQLTHMTNDNQHVLVAPRQLLEILSLRVFMNDIANCSNWFA